MKKKGIMIALVVAMVIGFAAITTTLVINGTIGVGANTDEYEVYYSNAKVNGVEDKSVIVDDTHIEFETEMKTIGDEYKLEYYITNGSRNYDADVTMNCTAGNDYVTVTNNWVDHTVIEATDTKSGILTLEMIKAYTESEPIELKVSCEIKAGAAERESLGTGTPANKVQKGVNLYNLMKENASTDTIDFSVNSMTSGTNGIYTTTETEGNVPVYYYRGAADQVNNNVIFNNMCWKIIRTTENNGVKLIYNGTPNAAGECVATGADAQIGTSAFNTSYNDNAYVGYMYGTPGSSSYEATHANTNNSTIKTNIDTWYTANFDAETTAKLEDTVFCNDRSTKAYDANTIGWTSGSTYGTLGYGTNATFYGAAHRASYYSNNPNPSLVCANANDKFTVSESYGNGALTNPVGLITLDEVVLAGYNTYYSNTSDYKNTTNYLHTGSTYWTFSPVNMGTVGNANVGTVNGAGNVDYNSVSNALGVRPVIALSSDTQIDYSGSGTSTNPYVVK